MNNYSLKKVDALSEKEKGVLVTAWRRLVPLLSQEGGAVTIALCAVLVSSATSLVVPLLIGHIVDVYIQGKNFHGVLMFSLVLSAIYLVGLVASYVQFKTMGGVGRRLLFTLRNTLFGKLQELPLTFFYQNKAGDLVSRINNDTDKLNQFFSQALTQFISNFVLIVGAALFLLVIHIKLGALALMPAAIALVLTQLLSPWVKRTNVRSLQSLGGMSGEIQESINNFKVVVAFNRLDYFREKFKEANLFNYHASVSAGIASNVFTPLYTLASATAQLAVLVYGIRLISSGDFTVGLLISFLLYVNNFYAPLRQLASVWSSLQLALAGLDRISEVLVLTDMEVTGGGTETPSAPQAIIEFKDVSFRYSVGDDILTGINFSLEKGKVYALVGPTGGGKTTTASLMARLYDPTEGTIFLEGKDIRSYDPSVRAQKIGFILQEPFLFTGTVRENILYGNPNYHGLSHEALYEILERENLTPLLARFPEGLDTKVVSSSDSISLGQKQLIAFIRAVLRRPDILILDEATANIDTVTEQLLEEILERLPASTTLVVIAHRLSTIESADEIFFVNGGEIIPAGSMEHAVEMLLEESRKS